MGRKARPKPGRLAEKLLQIREALGVSQSEMFRRLDVEEFSEVKRISDYETGKNEPPLMVLLSYARLAGVWGAIFGAVGLAFIIFVVV